MELIEGSNERIVFVAKNYKLRTKDGKRLTHFSGFMAQISAIIAVVMAAILDFILGFFIDINLGILWLISFIALFPIMWWPDPSRQTHTYTISIDKREYHVTWKGDGWNFYVPLRYTHETSLKIVKQSGVENSFGCHSVVLFVDEGIEIHIPVPDAESAKQIEREIASMLPHIPRDSFLDNVHYEQV